MATFADRKVAMVFRFYPAEVRPKMLGLRDLIFDTAQRIGLGDQLRETLKWGEPSYSCCGASAVRMDWKEAEPDCYKLFFHCQTSLVETFRGLYPGNFSFEGNRAIRFALNEEVNLTLLSHCIELALRYHSIKHLPMLGADVRSADDVF